MSELHTSKRRVSISATVVIALLSSVGTVAATYGSYRERFENLEKRVSAAEQKQQDADKVIALLTTQSAVVAAQYMEINRRLGAIENAVALPEGTRGRRER